MMDAYSAKIKLVLDRLIDENQEQSSLCDAMKTRLMDCGWKDQIKLECNRAIQRHGGLDDLNVAEVINTVTPVARSTIPIEVKKDIVALLQEALMKELTKMDALP